MKFNTRISGYKLEQKNIIIAKKEQNNINRLIDFTPLYNFFIKKYRTGLSDVCHCGVFR